MTQKDDEKDQARSDQPQPSAPLTHATEPPRGFVDGVLYCYGGCGTKYRDFPCDTLLPTPLWNRIAVGPPFDYAQVGIEREGRGGVLCPSCIIQRLVALPECTAVFADIEDRRAVTSEASPSSQSEAPKTPLTGDTMTPEQKIATAKRLLFEATRAIRRREQLARAADRCHCGHRRDEHAVSHSINYTEGYCMACPEKNHHNVCQWFNFQGTQAESPR